MNKEEVVYNTRQYRYPIIVQIAPAALAEKTGKGKEDRGDSYDSQGLCDAFCALTATFRAIVVQKQASDSTGKLSYKRLIRQRKGNSNDDDYHSVIYHPDSTDLGSRENAFLLRPKAPSVPSTLSICSSKKTINQRPVILMLLCLLSLDAVVSLMSLPSNGEPYNVTNVSSKSEPALRPIRAAKLLKNEPDNEILVRTTRHGFFKGRLMSSNRSPSLKASDISNDASVIGFLGIRYASAPTKRLRFMPPTAYHYASNQVHDMQNFGPICRQRLPVEFNYSAQSSTRNSEYETAKTIHSNGALNQDSFRESTNMDLHMRLVAKMMSRESFNYLGPLFKKLVTLEQSEDCLNLNIYVPKEALTKATGRIPQRAVLVIIHGESFDYGAGSTINGFKFVQQTRLITITFNYRLNMLGFPPKLAGASRGNLGLMDQVAALHWIKDNIGSFGGSPNNITLMGTKRGAIFVNLLMLSPLAKGLFQRAIMEDGSALTPIVANHIISPMGFSTNSLSYLPAAQHVRFLAKLCDCPVFQRTAAMKSLTNGSQFNMVTSGLEMTQQQQQLSSATADEIKANALTFECLRHKPIEQIMQPVPLDLLQFNQVNGELSIAIRWLRPLATSDQVDPGSPIETARISSQSNEDLMPVDARIINRLMLLATKEQIERIKAGNGDQSEDLRTSELFGALYAPSSSSVRPLFGPVEDGTIVPEEDMAGGMLKPGSAFAQRDLLIGLSQPVISSAIEEGSYDKTMAGHQPNQQDQGDTFEIGPDHIFFDRITAHMQQVGLTNEQAVSLVNVFVRSFYRYHNQEITNSIINHYLSNGRVVRARKLGSLRTNGRHGDESKISQQQLFVLDSLLEAFQDALINVPVLKTSLIHAIKQLEPLMEVFIGQQFKKWEQNSEQLFGGGGQYDQSRKQLNELQESFTSFAQSLFNDTNWPLELYSSSNLAIQQPKATYLYQFDSSVPLKKLKKLIDELAAKSLVSFGWKNVKQSLEVLLVKLQNSGSCRRMGFECIMQVDMDDETYSDNDHSGQYIVKKFSDWLCSKYSSILGSFILTGNVNTHSLAGEALQLQEDSIDWSPMSERIARFDAKCLSFKQQTADHHSVQLTELLETQNDNVNGTCRRELNSIVLDHLLSEFETRPRSDKSREWTVFNIFTQNVATLPAQKDLWHVGPISDGDLSFTQYDQKSTFSARSSFWANFVSALNCTKTQPVIPASLLSSSLASTNSSLLNLNLLFSCQYGGKTSYEAFESLINSTHQQLQTKIAQWRLNRLNPQQNHHSLRMATIGQTNSPDENLDQQDHLGAEPNRFNNLTNQYDLRLPIGFIGSNASDGSSANQSRTVLEFKAKYLGVVFIVCALVVSVTLVSGACAVIRQRKQNRDQRRKDTDTQINLDSRGQQIDQTQAQDDRDLLEQPKSSLSTNDTDNFAMQVSQTNVGQPIMEDNREIMISNDHNQPMGYDLHDPPPPPIHLNHVCALDSPNGYIYWDDNQQGMLNGSSVATLCRSHSSLNVPTNGNIITTTTTKNNNTNTRTTTQSHVDQIRSDQEPIMMPILASASQNVARQHQSQTSSLRRAGCLTNASTVNGFYGDSSSETQDHSRLSASKKRVKISDPLGTARWTSKKSEANSNHRMSSRSSGGQLDLNNPLYCPVHRDQVASAMAQVNTGYYMDEQGFISTSDQLWNENQINVMDSGQYVTTTNTNNCDHYNTSKGSSIYNTQNDHKLSSHNNSTNYISNHNPTAFEGGFRAPLGSNLHSSDYLHQHE